MRHLFERELCVNIDVNGTTNSAISYFLQGDYRDTVAKFCLVTVILKKEKQV